MEAIGEMNVMHGEVHFICFLLLLFGTILSLRSPFLIGWLDSDVLANFLTCSFIVRGIVFLANQLLRPAVGYQFGASFVKLHDILISGLIEKKPGFD